jgi:hypothetical protein
MRPFASDQPVNAAILSVVHEAVSELSAEKLADAGIVFIGPPLPLS